MKNTLLGSLALILFLSSSLAAQSDEYVLPDDKSKPVITMEMTGGFRMRPTEKPEPYISIFPDGKVVAGKTNPQQSRKEWNLSRDELQELMKFCIKENSMLEITSASIKKAIDESGKRIMVADAPNTDIMIKTAEKENKVSVYALFFARKQFGDIDSVKKVCAVEKKLKQLHTLTVLGGKEKMKEALKLANAEIKSQDKNSPELTADDVNSAFAQKDGSVRVSIGKQITNEQGMAQASYNVSVVFEKGKKGSAQGRVWKRQNR